MAKINLSQYQFTLRDPYQAGQTMTELEANILNYHRADQIRRIVKPWIVEYENNSREEILSLDALDRLTDAITQLDLQYELPFRSPPSAPAFEHQLRIVAMDDLQSKHGPLEMLDNYRDLFPAAMADPANRAKARRILLAHLNAVYEDRSE